MNTQIYLSRITVINGIFNFAIQNGLSMIRMHNKWMHIKIPRCLCIINRITGINLIS